MKPYWTSKCGRHEIWHGDCLEILPTLGKVDAIVTDPPYGLGDKWKGGAGEFTASSWRFDPTEAMEWDSVTCNKEIEEIIKMKIPTVIWGGNYYNLAPVRGWFVWDKKQPDTWSTGQAELAWTNIDRSVRVFRLAQCEAHSEMKDKEHPTQKPVSLISWCIRMMKIPEATTLCDPFAGSCSTGIACIENNKRSILIEKMEKYCKIGIRKMEEALGTIHLTKGKDSMKLRTPKMIPTGKKRKTR
jgi:site-specific DNA-methyltransferase (adenine-specific)